MATVTQIALGGRWIADAAYMRKLVNDPPGLCAQPGLVDRDLALPLSMLIEREIIPRLMASHASGFRPPSEAGANDDRDTILSAEIDAFAPLVMQVEADVLLAHVEAILRRGVTVEAVMVDLLAPAARVLGDYWEDDRCDFVDVTMGLWRLQEVAHEIAGRSPAGHASAAGNRRALFVSMKGDHHSFGTVVIDEVFRRGGWLTDRISDVETPELLDAAAGDWFDMIGLTISCDCNIADLESLIAALRKVSRNPGICIMVGGALFSADPELATKVGADGTARDAKLALEVADDLLRKRG